MKSPITTHVLDLALGRPASGLEVVLERAVSANQWEALATRTTNEDGRIMHWEIDDTRFEPGTYRITFKTADYLTRVHGQPGFYPYVPIVFETQAGQPHYHVPLLLNLYGYSTYRGS